MKFPRHLVTIDDLSRQDIMTLITRAESLWTGAEIHPDLRGRAVLQYYAEPSTRTAGSFFVACAHLGVQSQLFQDVTMSTVKGEPVDATLITFASMGPDVVIVRHPDDKAAHRMVGMVEDRTAVVSAGCGQSHHPTQALGDLFLLFHEFHRIEGLEVAILGDIEHSRVARSLTSGLLTCGAHVRIAPHNRRTPNDWPYKTPTFDSVHEAVRGAHAVVTLRVQKERIVGDAEAISREVSRRLRLQPEHLELMHPEGIIMHPGPMNIGVEISREVIGPRFRMFRQVAHGQWMRTAVLETVLLAHNAK